MGVRDIYFNFWSDCNLDCISNVCVNYVIGIYFGISREVVNISYFVCYGVGYYLIE